MFKVTCTKCKGVGTIPCFGHVDGGICYECKGDGFTLRKTKPVDLIRFHVTAIIKDGYADCGNRGGIFVNAKNEKDALKKARLHPDSFDLETKKAVIACSM